MLRAAIEPVIAVAFLVAWVLIAASATTSAFSSEVEARTETFVTNPYGIAMAIGLALAIALVRCSPIASLAIAAAVLVCQLLFWPPRFGQTSWVAYLGILLIAIGIGAYGGRVFRWIGLGLLALCGVAVSALLTLPSLSLSGTWGTINGKPWSSPDVFSGFGIYSVVWAGLVVGAWFIGRRIRRALASDHPTRGATVAPAALAILSPREHEIFLLAARGLSNAEIATSAHIGESTVKTHLANISGKLGFASRSALVVFAYESGAVRVREAANEDLAV